MQKIIKLGVLLLMVSSVNATMTRDIPETSSYNNWERTGELSSL